MTSRLGKECPLSTADQRPPNPSPVDGPSSISGMPLRAWARDPDEARRVVTESYLPHQLWVSGAVLSMELLCARFGDLTAGLLSYGAPVHVVTEETTQFHINLTMSGRAASKSGHAEPVVSTADEGVAFTVGEPAQVTWSANCRQLCLMAPRAAVEGALELLLGRRLREPLAFESSVGKAASGALAPALKLVRTHLEMPTDLLARPEVARHVEGMVLDGLLLTQPHNYRDLLFSEGSAATTAVARAAELLEAHPAEPWSVVCLARRVGLGVRALHYGFRRDFNLTPMEYLRTVRLRHAHALLLRAAPDSTTVREVAAESGFLHFGRFAASYRDVYGEAPSNTLARQP